MESPWSTPTQSEIGEAEQALNAKVANDFIMDSDPLAQREMGDGEPSFDANVDDFMANNRLGRIFQARKKNFAQKVQCVIQLIQDDTRRTEFAMTNQFQNNDSDFFPQNLLFIYICFQIFF